MPTSALSSLLLPTGWFVVLLAAPGLLILAAVVLTFLFRRPVPPERRRGPGYYHVLGFDAQTNARREMTIQADTESGARGRAELDGVVVTEVKAVDGGDDGPTQ